MQIIKYQYALNSSGKTVNIESLIASPEVRREQFKCLSCDNVLIPVLGQTRKKHFRHKAEIKCSHETYLHKLAKQTFYEVYKGKDIPIYCQIFKQRFHQKAAYHCQYYLPDDKFIDNLYLIID